MVEGIGSPMGLTHPVIEDEGGRGELARQINTQILFKQIHPIILYLRLTLLYGCCHRRKSEAGTQTGWEPGGRS